MWNIPVSVSGPIPFTLLEKIFRGLNGAMPQHIAQMTTRGRIQLWLRLTDELSVLIGEKIDRGLASLRSPIRF